MAAMMVFVQVGYWEVKKVDKKDEILAGWSGSLQDSMADGLMDLLKVCYSAMLLAGCLVVGVAALMVSRMVG